MKYYSVFLYNKGYKVNRNKGKTKVSLPPTCALTIKNIYIYMYKYISMYTYNTNIYINIFFRKFVNTSEIGLYKIDYSLNGNIIEICL